jgi:hypothetical protein
MTHRDSIFLRKDTRELYIGLCQHEGVMAWSARVSTPEGVVSRDGFESSATAYLWLEATVKRTDA